ncbi:MAG: hypothetical protein ABI678_22140 [Kofleriaceae bacterium]
MKRAIVIAAIAIAVIAVISLRAVIAGRGELADGDDWMLRGKPSLAIRSYEAAARWYVPFAPHVDTAYARLRDLTKSPAEILAWRAIRSAARATRTLWQPHGADLADADVALARLAARDPEAGAGAGNTTADREAWYRARYAEDPRPSRGAAVLAGFGILLVLGGVGVVVRRRPHWAAGAAIVVGIACWLVGLYNA